MQTFWEAFKNSTILQGILSIIIWAAICYMVVIGESQLVPDSLWGAGALVLGFYFGAKVQAATFSRQRQ